MGFSIVKKSVVEVYRFWLAFKTKVIHDYSATRVSRSSYLEIPHGALARVGLRLRFESLREPFSSFGDWDQASD